MSGYIKKGTQEARILELLSTRGPKGVYAYEIVTPRPLGGLGICGYTARIWGLRQKGFNIVDKKVGWYVLEGNSYVQPELSPNL